MNLEIFEVSELCNICSGVLHECEEMSRYDFISEDLLEKVEDLGEQENNFWKDIEKVVSKIDKPTNYDESYFDDDEEVDYDELSDLNFEADERYKEELEELVYKYLDKYIICK